MYINIYWVLTSVYMAYHTKNTKRTNMYGNGSMSLQDVRNFYCQPSSVASSHSYHSLAMSTVTTRCQNHTTGNSNGSHRRGKPHKSWRDNIKEWTSQSLSSSKMTEVDGQPYQQKGLSEYTYDAWAPRELVSWLCGEVMTTLMC